MKFHPGFSNLKKKKSQPKLVTDYLSISMCGKLEMHSKKVHFQLECHTFWASLSGTGTLQAPPKWHPAGRVAWAPCGQGWAIGRSPGSKLGFCTLRVGCWAIGRHPGCNQGFAPCGGAWAIGRPSGLMLGFCTLLVGLGNCPPPGLKLDRFF